MSCESRPGAGVAAELNPSVWAAFCCPEAWVGGWVGVVPRGPWDRQCSQGCYVWLCKVL